MNRPIERSLAASSQRVATASPVFIVGQARSGTSILFRTLQKHSAFAPTHVDLHETQIFARLPLAATFDVRPPRNLVGYMLKDRAHWQAFLDETRRIRLASAVTAPVGLPRQGDVPLAVWRAQRLHLVVRSYLAHAWEARGCRRLAEKSPRNVPHLAKIRLVSPDARMIFLARHPIDTYSSYLKRAKTDPDARWADISVRKFSRIWRSAAQGAAAEASARPQSMLVLRYEDFTSDPASEFRRICDFVGEPFEQGAVEEDNPQVGKWKPDQNLYGAITAQTKKWEEFVTPEAARQVEDGLADVMAALGYARYT